VVRLGSLAGFVDGSAAAARGDLLPGVRGMDHWGTQSAGAAREYALRALGRLVRVAERFGAGHYAQLSPLGFRIERI